MTLLLGNSETGFTSGKALASGHAAAFAFTASETGLLEELQFRTNGVANTGVTSVRLGVFTDNAGLPSNHVVQEGVYSVTPGENAWIAVTGLGVPILKNAKYWLAVQPIGGALHYSVHGARGSTNVRVNSEEKSKLYEVREGAWEAAAEEGPVGFYGAGKAVVGTKRKLLFGIDSGGATPDRGHSATWVSHKVIVERGSPFLDFEYTASPMTVSAHVGEALAAGILVPLVLINVNDETLLHNVTPATYAEKAAAIIKKVTEEHPTVTTFELINEPYLKGAKPESGGKQYPGSNASDYADCVYETYKKVAEEGITGVTLLVAAYGTYQKVDAEGVGTGEFSEVRNGEGWVADILSTQTSLKEGGAHAITGWTSHPYGKPVDVNSEADYGFLSVITSREAAKLHKGAGVNNWWITEVGFKIEGSETEALQASQLLEDLEQAQLLGEAGWLKGFIVYADSEEVWNIYGKVAGTTYENFANEHGLTHTWSGATKRWVEDNFTWSEVDAETEY